MVKLIASGTTFEAPQEFEDMTTFFKDVREFEGNKDEFVFNLIKKEDMENILNVSRIVNYSFKKVPKVTSNDPRAYLSEELVEFFKGLKNEELNDLFKAAKQLRIADLENNIAVFIATKVWIKLTLEEYNKKRAELGITEDLTPEKSRELKEKYPFLN